MKPTLRQRWRAAFPAAAPERTLVRWSRRMGWTAFLFFFVGLAPTIAHAARGKPKSDLQAIVGGADLLGGDSISNRPLILMTAMAGLALLPFVGMMVTSFVKIAVVLSITRQAIGMQQAPPTTVITGMAIILTVYVMQPVGLQIYNRVDKLVAIQRGGDVMAKENVDLIIEAAKMAKEPIKAFLMKNSNKKDRDMFYRVAFRMRAEEDRAALGPDEWPEYQAFVREEEASRREIFANRLLADLQTTLHLSDSQKDTLFAHFATETTASEIDSGRTPIESMDPAQTEKLADVLSEEQFKLWRQRAEIWSQLFRRSPDTPPRAAR